jgi:hypothetical protein
MGKKPMQALSWVYARDKTAGELNELCNINEKGTARHFFLTSETNISH